MRIGNGYDVHRLVENRKLILGGVEIPYEKGLLGHSDADVLLHAVMDALLGAAALGDIGKHFPDNGSKVGLKAQKLLAQGIALGIMAISKTPCKGKSFKIPGSIQSFCPYRASC